MVNIEELSAKELYELARKKEQEEERLAQVQKQLLQLREERKEMLSKHEKELAETDQKIDELKAQRASMVESQQRALELVDKRLKAMEAEGAQASEQPDDDASLHQADEEDEALLTPVDAEGETLPSPSDEEGEILPPPIEEKDGSPAEPPTPTPARPKETKAAEGDEMEALKEHLQKMMKGRSYISEGLMRERLQAAKFKPSNLGKMLETLVKEGWLVRRSGGNYVMGRGSKKK